MEKEKCQMHLLTQYKCNRKAAISQETKPGCVIRLCKKCNARYLDTVLDGKVKDALERDGWRREGNYLGRDISQRWERAYKFFRDKIQKGEQV
jgi:hypothetical protein